MKLGMLVAVAASLGAATTAAARDWTYVHFDQRSAVMINITTMREIPMTQKRVAWVAYLWPEVRPDGANYHMVQMEFDCRAMTVASLSSASYLEDGSVGQRSNRRNPTEPVIPDSVGHAIYDSACGIDRSDIVVTDLAEAIAVYRSLNSEGSD